VPVSHVEEIIKSVQKLETEGFMGLHATKTCGESQQNPREEEKKPVRTILSASSCTAYWCKDLGDQKGLTDACFCTGDAL